LNVTDGRTDGETTYCRIDILSHDLLTTVDTKNGAIVAKNAPEKCLASWQLTALERSPSP